MKNLSLTFDRDLAEDQILEMFKVMSLGTNLETLGIPSDQILSKALNNIQSVMG